MAQRRTPQEIAILVIDMSYGGTRPIKLIFDNRRPLRDFIVKSVSEDEGGYLTGQERGHKRIHVVKFQDIRDVGS